MAAQANAWNRQLAHDRDLRRHPDRAGHFYTALYHACSIRTCSATPTATTRLRRQDPHAPPAATPSTPTSPAGTSTAPRCRCSRCSTPAQPPTWPPRCSTTPTRAAGCPSGRSANGYTGVMNGDAADPILADAYAFGARGFDATRRAGRMVNGATAHRHARPGLVRRAAARPAAYIADGYVPNIGSDSISPVPNGASETAGVRPRRLRDLPTGAGRIGDRPRRRVPAALAELGQRLRHRRPATSSRATPPAPSPPGRSGHRPAAASGRTASRRATPRSTPGWSRRTSRPDRRHGRRPGGRAPGWTPTSPSSTRAQPALPLAGQRARVRHAVGLRQRRRSRGRRRRSCASDHHPAVLADPRRRAGQRRPRRDELLVRLGGARAVPADPGRADARARRAAVPARGHPRRVPTT